MKRQYVILLTTLFAVSLAHGDFVAVSNLNETVLGSGAQFSATVFQGVEFHTGDKLVELSNITFLRGDLNPGTYGRVSLYSSVSDEPGSVLLTMSTPSGSTSEGDSITVTGSYALTMNTSYFIILSTTSEIGGANAYLTDSTADTQGDVGAVGDGWWIGDSTWHSLDSGGSWTHNNTTPLMVSVGVVPEPATLSLIALVGGGIILGRRIFRI